MRQVPAFSPVLVLVLCALLLPAARLRADAGTDLRKDLLAATVKAIGLEIEATRRKLQAAEEGTGPKENVERSRQKIRDLEAEQLRFVLPPVIREVTVKSDGPITDGTLLPVEATSKSGPRREYFGLIGNFYVHVLP